MIRSIDWGGAIISIGNALSNAWPGIKRSASDAIGWASNLLNAIGESVKQFVTGIFSSIIDWIKFWFALPVIDYFRKRKVYNAKKVLKYVEGGLANVYA